MKKFNAMLAPHCLPRLEEDVSTPVRRAGIAAWVSAMDSGCRGVIVGSNATFARDVAVQGRGLVGT